MRPTQKDGLEPLALQPSEHIAMNLALDGLVQDLMAHAGVKLLGHALNARLAIHLRCAMDAGAALAHRVLIAGHEQQRQRMRDPARQTQVRCVGHQARQHVICADGELPTAQGIALVFGNDLGVGGEPVQISLGVLDGPAVAAGTHSVNELAHIALAVLFGQ